MRAVGRFCRRCYADLEQAIDEQCLRCGRKFSRDNAATYLSRPFPSRFKIIVHTTISLTLATLISLIVAFFVGLAQLKYLHSGH